MAKIEEMGTEKNLEEQVAQLREEIKHITTTVNDFSSQNFDDLQRKASHFYAHAKENGQEAMDEMKDRFYHMESQVCDYVRHKPGTSLAIAAGIGFLTALMTRR